MDDPRETDLEPLLQTIVERAASLLATPRVSVRLVNANNTRLIASARAGEPLHTGTPVGFLRGQGLIGWIAQHVTPLRIDWAEDDPRFVPRARMQRPVGAFLGVPMIADGGCVGVISAVHPERGYFTEQHERTLAMFARTIAPYLDAARRSPSKERAAVSPDGSSALDGADKRVFALSRVESRPLIAALDARLPRQRITREGANWLPKAQHHVTTIYFDTPARDLFRAASTGAAPFKLRAREYADPHPQLAEVSIDPSSLIRYQPLLWLDLSLREGGQKTRRRVGLPKRDVPAFFAHGTITDEMIALQVEAGAPGDAEAAALLAEVAALCGRHREPLRADCVVTHRRLAWRGDRIAISVDVEHEIFAPPDGLWTRDTGPLVRATLGTPLDADPECLIGCRAVGAPPAWLDALLTTVRAQPRSYSKFDRASRVVHSSYT